MDQTPAVVTKERLLEEFNAVVAETEQLIKSMTAAGSDKAGALKAGVEQGLADAGERISRIREEALSQAGVAARATDDYVHDNPWLAIGIVASLAAATGLVAGLLISRR